MIGQKLVMLSIQLLWILQDLQNLDLVPHNKQWSWCMHIDRLVQERRNSIANALELHLFALTYWYDIEQDWGQYWANA